MGQWVLHVDLDQFIAAVEVMRRPELEGLPVVVGGRGDPTQRGVVATASYEAREFGVGSGMPLRTALKKCPGAIFLPMDMPAYLEASEQVMAVLRSFPVVVEVLGMDEAFVGAETDDPHALAEEIRARILEKTGLHSSVGIGDSWAARGSSGGGGCDSTVASTSTRWSRNCSRSSSGRWPWTRRLVSSSSFT